MISKISREFLINFPTQKSSKRRNTIENAAKVCENFEFALYLIAMVLAHLITINRLPKHLDFLKGRFQLANTMMHTALIALVIDKIVLGLILESDFYYKRQSPVEEVT